jgi:methylenetetrahydrofolate dehydrogenase (NADP+)/methenyltetrahydrofolate cyclohydrolase
MKILYGDLIAEKIYKNLKKEKEKLKIKPGMAVIMIGKNKASQIYIRLKQEAAKKLGFYFKKYLFLKKVDEGKVLKIIKNLNEDRKIHGIIVQLPLPKNFNPFKIVQTISPEKDIDGFHPKTKFISPTHQAILKLLSFYKIKIKNKKIVIFANSLIFARPLQKILKRKKGKTKIVLKKDYLLSPIKYEKYLKEADILIIAIGQPKFLKKEMIKKGVIIIDVGYSRIKKKPVGDVDFKNCSQKAKAISPVPGGVGPLTVAFLMKNVLLAAKKFFK